LGLFDTLARQSEEIIVTKHGKPVAKVVPASSSQLPKAVKRKIGGSESFAVSLASVWEIAIKVQIGKLRLDLPVEDWVRRSLGNPQVRLQPITPTLAVYSTTIRKATS